MTELLQNEQMQQCTNAILPDLITYRDIYNRKGPYLIDIRISIWSPVITTTCLLCYDIFQTQLVIHYLLHYFLILGVHNIAVGYCRRWEQVYNKYQVLGRPFGINLSQFPRLGFGTGQQWVWLTVDWQLGAMAKNQMHGRREFIPRSYKCISRLYYHCYKACNEKMVNRYKTYEVAHDKMNMLHHALAETDWRCETAYQLSHIAAIKWWAVFFIDASHIMPSHQFHYGF